MIVDTYGQMFYAQSWDWTIFRSGSAYYFTTL